MTPLAAAIAAEFDAWERFTEASSRAARTLRGGQYDLFDQAREEARFWLETTRACAAEVVRHG